MAVNLVVTLTPLEEMTLEMSKVDSSAYCIIPCAAVLRCLLETEGPNRNQDSEEDHIGEPGEKVL